MPAVPGFDLGVFIIGGVEAVDHKKQRLLPQVLVAHQIHYGIVGAHRTLVGLPSGVANPEVVYGNVGVEPGSSRCCLPGNAASVCSADRYGAKVIFGAKGDTRQAVAFQIAQIDHIFGLCDTAGQKCGIATRARYG